MRTGANPSESCIGSPTNASPSYLADTVQPDFATDIQASYSSHGRPPWRHQHHHHHQQILRHQMISESRCIALTTHSWGPWSSLSSLHISHPWWMSLRNDMWAVHEWRDGSTMWQVVMMKLGQINNEHSVCVCAIATTIRKCIYERHCHMIVFHACSTPSTLKWRTIWSESQTCSSALFTSGQYIFILPEGLMTMSPMASKQVPTEAGWFNCSKTVGILWRVARKHTTCTIKLLTMKPVVQRSFLWSHLIDCIDNMLPLEVYYVCSCLVQIL